MRTLKRLVPLRDFVIGLRIAYLNRFWGMSIHPSAKISFSAKLDKTYPIGVFIGEGSYLTFGATILCHDMVRHVRTSTRILENCFIGANAVIMPGVTVGPNAIVGAGSVVTRDVPPFSICVGNPAKVVRTSPDIGRYGIIASTRPQSRTSRASGADVEAD